MRIIKPLLLTAGLVFMLSACHFPGHHPPGHGGVPPGQAKKVWHKPPGHKKHLDDGRIDTAPRFY
jgi:hypothetical protein